MTKQYFTPMNTGPIVKLRRTVKLTVGRERGGGMAE